MRPCAQALGPFFCATALLAAGLAQAPWHADTGRSEIGRREEYKAQASTTATLLGDQVNLERSAKERAEVEPGG